MRLANTGVILRNRQILGGIGPIGDIGTFGCLLGSYPLDEDGEQFACAAERQSRHLVRAA
jgi:hypothetical protein